MQFFGINQINTTRRCLIKNFIRKKLLNKSEIYDGLYFVGAGTHPGAGVPGVLSSAKVLDKLF